MPIGTLPEWPASRTLISTAQGTHQQAFGPTEWGLLAFIAGVWGSSFLLIAIGLDDFAPGVVTFGRILFGMLGLAFVPARPSPHRAGGLAQGRPHRVHVDGPAPVAVPHRRALRGLVRGRDDQRGGAAVRRLLRLGAPGHPAPPAPGHRPHDRLPRCRRHQPPQPARRGGVAGRDRPARGRGGALRAVDQPGRARSSRSTAGCRSCGGSRSAPW